MTDKQIIIDGVDVRKCVNRRWDNSQKIHLCYDSDTPLTSWGWCENNPNCYYKQLKRKEQENKDLREDIKDIANLLGLDTGEEYNFGNVELEIKQLKAKEQECETLASQLDFEVQKKECLEQECEELKIYIESNEQQVKEVETLVMDNDRLINELDQLKAENEELKSVRDSWISKCEQETKVRELYQDGLDQLKAENQELKQTLTEIKVIANNAYCLTNYTNKDMAQFAKQILQICDEVNDV